jgi:hypothetical protein
MFIVIAQSPSVDTSQAVGAYRTMARAVEVSQDLDGRGYITEVCELLKLADIDYSPPWDGRGYA